jgi:circadian clock protein KaiC
LPGTSHVPTLDESLEDSYWPGSTTLVAGPSGVGKTLMGLQFLFQGGLRNEPGILLSLQENRYQLGRIIERFGWSIDDPSVRVIDRSPVDVYIDQLVYELLDIVGEMRARRVVLDSLNDLGQNGADHARFTEFIYCWLSAVHTWARASCHFRDRRPVSRRSARRQRDLTHD